MSHVFGCPTSLGTEHEPEKLFREANFLSSQQWLLADSETLRARDECPLTISSIAVVPRTQKTDKRLEALG